MVRVVAHDHAFAALDAADAGDQAGAVDGVVVHAVGGERRQFEKRRAGIEQPHDAVARQQLAARHMALAGALRAAERGFGAALACSSSASARMRAALAGNSAEPVSMLDAIGNRIPSAPQLYASHKANVNGPSEWNKNESSETFGTDSCTRRCPVTDEFGHEGITRGDVGMKKSLLATVAAAALIAGTGLASAEGAKEQPGMKAGAR